MDIREIRRRLSTITLENEDRDRVAAVVAGAVEAETARVLRAAASARERNPSADEGDPPEQDD